MDNSLMLYDDEMDDDTVDPSLWGEEALRKVRGLLSGVKSYNSSWMQQQQQQQQSPVHQQQSIVSSLQFDSDGNNSMMRLNENTGNSESLSLVMEQDQSSNQQSPRSKLLSLHESMLEKCRLFRTKFGIKNSSPEVFQSYVEELKNDVDLTYKVTSDNLKRSFNSSTMMMENLRKESESWELILYAFQLRQLPQPEHEEFHLEPVTVHKTARRAVEASFRLDVDQRFQRLHAVTEWLHKIQHEVKTSSHLDHFKSRYWDKTAREQQPTSSMDPDANLRLKNPVILNVDDDQSESSFLESIWNMIRAGGYYYRDFHYSFNEQPSEVFTNAINQMCEANKQSWRKASFQGGIPQDSYALYFLWKLSCQKLVNSKTSSSMSFRYERAIYSMLIGDASSIIDLDVCNSFHDFLWVWTRSIVIAYIDRTIYEHERLCLEQNRHLPTSLLSKNKLDEHGYAITRNLKDMSWDSIFIAVEAQLGNVLEDRHEQFFYTIQKDLILGRIDSWIRSILQNYLYQNDRDHPSLESQIKANQWPKAIRSFVLENSVDLENIRFASIVAVLFYDSNTTGAVLDQKQPVPSKDVQNLLLLYFVLLLRSKEFMALLNGVSLLVDDSLKIALLAAVFESVRHDDISSLVDYLQHQPQDLDFNNKVVKPAVETAMNHCRELWKQEQSQHNQNQHQRVPRLHSSLTIDSAVPMTQNKINEMKDHGPLKLSSSSEWQLVCWEVISQFALLVEVLKGCEAEQNHHAEWILQECLNQYSGEESKHQIRNRMIKKIISCLGHTKPSTSIRLYEEFRIAEESFLEWESRHQKNLSSLKSSRYDHSSGSVDASRLAKDFIKESLQLLQQGQDSCALFLRNCNKHGSSLRGPDVFDGEEKYRSLMLKETLDRLVSMHEVFCLAIMEEFSNVVPYPQVRRDRGFETSNNDIITQLSQVVDLITEIVRGALSYLDLSSVEIYLNKVMNLANYMNWFKQRHSQRLDPNFEYSFA